MDAVDAGALIAAVRTAGELDESTQSGRSSDQRFGKRVVVVLVIAQAIWIATLAYLVFVSF